MQKICGLYNGQTNLHPLSRLGDLLQTLIQPHIKKLFPLTYNQSPITWSLHNSIVGTRMNAQLKDSTLPRMSGFPWKKERPGGLHRTMEKRKECSHLCSFSVTITISFTYLLYISYFTPKMPNWLFGYYKTLTFLLCKEVHQ